MYDNFVALDQVHVHNKNVLNLIKGSYDKII